LGSIKIEGRNSLKVVIGDVLDGLGTLRVKFF